MIVSDNDSYFKEVFEEFFKLSYTLKNNPLRNKIFSDHKIIEYVILRVTPTGDYIHYLYNGSSIFIPWEWIDLFSSFNIHSGFRILECYDEDVDGSLSRFGYLMVKLISHLDQRLSSIDGENLLNILGELSVIGTKEFREWYSMEFGMNLDSFEYRSLDENLNI